jgi:hypothetical protein
LLEGPVKLEERPSSQRDEPEGGEKRKREEGVPAVGTVAEMSRSLGRHGP